MKARKFAEEEIRPISLERDADRRSARDLRLGDHQEGLEARLPHHGGAEGMGRPRHRFRDPGAGHGRARQGRQRDLEDLQPVLEVEPPDRREPAPTSRRSASSSRSSPTTPSCSARASASRAPAPTTGCRRKTIPRPGLKLRAERHGDEWILNGEKCFIANAQRRQAVLHRRAHRPECAAQAGHHDVPGAARHAGLPHRQGVQQERLALLPERRDDLRERARAARQRRRAR